MKTLYLMRHGQTIFNVRHKIQGWCDSPLTQVGIQQAKIAGEYFIKHNITFDHAYSSTAERASDTLEYVVNMPYKRLKGLKEWGFGVYEGENDYLMPKRPYGDYFISYGGEGEKQMQQRVADTLFELMQQEDHHNVLAVSHGASCKQFIRYWQHTSDIKQEGKIENCCILKFEFDNDTFKLVEVINHDFQSLE